MEAQINLDQGRTIYSNGDRVTGEIMLLAECTVHVSSIVVTLFLVLQYPDQGLAKTVKSIRYVLRALLVEAVCTNCIQLLQKSQNIVTGDEVGGDARLGMVISKGQHAFPFSMTVRGIYKLASDKT